MTNQAQKTANFSTQLAIASFTIGTLLFLVYHAFHFDQLLMIGLLYIVIAFILNAVTMLYLIYFLITERHEKEYFLFKIFIMLANIPIVFFYLNIMKF